MLSNFTYFVSLVPTKAALTFSGQYTDREGYERKIVTSRDQHGNDILRRFKFTRQHRAIKIPNTQQDVIEFLRNHPWCEGSPNNPGKNAMFKEINEGRDAQIAIDAKKLKNKAETIALNLEGEELFEIAILCGHDSKDEGLALHAVGEYATNNPQGFLEIYEDESRKAGALFKKCVRAGLIKKKGFMFYWNEVHLGNKEDEVIKKIYENTELEKGITRELKEAGGF